VLRAHDSFGEWVIEKKKKYETWEATCNEEKQFKQEDIPGWWLVKTMEKALRINSNIGNSVSKDNTSNSSSEPAPVFEITNNILDLYRYHNPDRELRTFPCSDHPYLRIAPVWELGDEEKAYFDSDGMLLPTFFEMLERKYDSLDVQSESGGKKDNLNGSEHSEETVEDNIFRSIRKGAILAQPTPMMEFNQDLDANLVVPSEISAGSWSTCGTDEADLLNAKLSEIANELSRKKFDHTFTDTDMVINDEILRETAWQLAQAMFRGEVSLPPLAEL